MLVAVYLIESGLLLVLVPWSSFWERNYFGRALPSLGVVMANPFARGAVTGVGLITALAGLRELAGAFTARPHPQPPHDGTPGQTT